MANPHTHLVPRPIPQSVNSGLSSCKASTLKTVFGMPREHLGRDCQDVTSARLSEHIVKAHWFGQAIRGLDLATIRLKRIEAKIRQFHPELVPHMGTAGMLCCRLVRGSSTSPSNHSWGTAIDLTYDGEVDVRGDGQCQQWLLDVYSYFHEEGFYWGTEFPTEDSMHFEVADETIRAWYPQHFGETSGPAAKAEVPAPAHVAEHESETSTATELPKAPSKAKAVKPV